MQNQSKVASSPKQAMALLLAFVLVFSLLGQPHFAFAASAQEGVQETTPDNYRN